LLQFLLHASYTHPARELDPTETTPNAMAVLRLVEGGRGQELH